MTHDQLEAIRAALRTTLAQILYRRPDEIAGGTAFPDLGLDSILGVELVIDINKRYQLEETIQLLYAAPTLDELADHLLNATTDAAEAGAEAV